MSILRLTPEQAEAHQKRMKLEAMAAAANEDIRKITRIKDAPLGRPFPASGLQTQRPNKFHARKTGAYASGKESERAKELRLLEKAGKVRNLREKVVYELLPRQYVDGKMVEREVSYVSDSDYEELVDGKWLPVTEDVKGYKDGAAYNLFKLKRKLMLWVHGISIRET